MSASPNEEVIKSPIKFGSDVDFKLAIQELKWLISVKNKITNNDYQIISEKYNLPVNFLKKGVSGLKYPDDYKMSDSKWFPIYYSWAIQNHERFVKLLKLKINYEKSHVSSILIPIMAAFILGNFAWILYRNDLTYLLGVILFGIIPISLSLYFELFNNVLGKRLDLEVCKQTLKNEGYESIITEVDKFIQTNMKYIVHAQDIILKKIEEGGIMQLFHMGSIEDEEGNKAPVFFSEDIQNIYYERMKSIMKK